MKKHHVIIGIICWVLTIGSVMGIFARHMFNMDISDAVGELSNKRDEVYSEEGFYDIRYETEDPEYVLIEGHVITEDDINELEGVEECWMGHFDIYSEEAISFIDSHINEWPPYDWKRRESVEYIDYEFKRDLHRYTKEIHWYSEKYGDGGIAPKIYVNADAVSGRIHSISIRVPNEINSKEAFIQTMQWMGYEGDSERIFYKMFDTIKKLGNNEGINYMQDHYDFSMREFDYTNLDTIGPDKMYGISIRLQND